MARECGLGAQWLSTGLKRRIEVTQLFVTRTCIAHRRPNTRAHIGRPKKRFHADLSSVNASSTRCSAKNDRARRERTNFASVKQNHRVSLNKGMAAGLPPRPSCSSDTADRHWTVQPLQRLGSPRQCSHTCSHCPRRKRTYARTRTGRRSPQISIADLRSAYAG